MSSQKSSEDNFGIISHKNWICIKEYSVFQKSWGEVCGCHVIALEAKLE